MNNDLVIEYGAERRKRIEFLRRNAIRLRLIDKKELSNEMRDWLGNADQEALLWDVLNQFCKEFDVTGYEGGLLVGKWMTETI